MFSTSIVAKLWQASIICVMMPISQERVKEALALYPIFELGMPPEQV